MIIFHAGFYDRQLHLWGEAPSESNATYTRKAKAASAKPLAYDAGSEALITGLLEIVPDLETDARDTREATIWLPHRAGGQSSGFGK